MKSLRLLVFLVLLFLFSSFNMVHCGRNYVEYRIQLNSDTSASWTILVVSDINAMVDSWEGFQQKIFTLVEGAVNVTGTEMAVAPETINMETVVSWETQSKTTEFSFKWLNFSMPEDNRLVLRDVFSGLNSFEGLYGDGTLLISHPVGYHVVAVYPSPDRQDAASQTIEWFRAQDFLNSNPSVTLASDQSLVQVEGWVWYVVLGLVFAMTASLAGVYFVRRRGSKTVSTRAGLIAVSLLESDEEKVIKYLESSGGSLPQSKVGDQFGFSKAKTSQLLSSLERRSIVARYKSGRKKIVTLIKRTSGDES